MSAPPATLVEPLSYAHDDGLAFLDWAPPLLEPDEAAQAYDAGERIAVLSGDPARPPAALVLDRRNGRAVFRVQGESGRPARRLVFLGKTELRLAEAQWSAAGNEFLAERHDDRLLRVRRRPMGAWVWTDELLAARSPQDAERASWPEFGDWAELARISLAEGSDWWDDGVLDLVDADGWLLDALADADIGRRWRELARKHDAPRAIALPPPLQAKLAEPLDWHPVGRRWRKADEVVDAGKATIVITDVSFGTGAGAGCAAQTTVVREPIEVVVSLPHATGRLEARSNGRPGNPAAPRPSASAQVAITAVLTLAGEAHEAFVEAVRAGAVPRGWATLVG